MGFNTYVICASFLLVMTQIIMAANVSPNVKTFFADKIKGNLTKVTWAHAVNNKELLDKTIKDASIMMVEADVVLGHLNKSNETIPVMAHPPENSSDLSLVEFLQTMIQHGKKGVKLDFKSIQAFDASYPILEKQRANMTFPVWLNADILHGPVNANTTPVNAQEFLAKAGKSFPESTLSIGWTTKYGPKENINYGEYNQTQVEEMINTVSNISQTITYPVRAGMAANNITLFSNLLKKTAKQNSTLTLWSSENDTVDAKKLSKLVKEIGVDKVYIDVPKELWAKLNISAASGVSPALLLSICVVFTNIMLAKLF